MSSKLLRLLTRSRFHVGLILRSPVVLKGCAMATGFAGVAYFTVSKLLYTHPGLADAINYITMLVACYYFHEVDS